MKRATRGFTLIELLVVISIVALLVGIVLPALGKSRETARRTKCLANLKGIGVGLQLYMDAESKDQQLLPLVRPLNTGSNENDPSLLDVLSQYTDAAVPYKDEATGKWTSPDPWKCPSDADGGNGEPQWRSSGTSYDYPPGLLMTAAELMYVRNPQFGVSKAIAAEPQYAVLVDFDNWHHPRYTLNNRQNSGGNSDPDGVTWDRNGLFFGDWRADKVPFVSIEDGIGIFEKIVQYGGGINP